MNNYFWRIWEQDEIDFIEERGGILHGYEFRWKKRKSKGQKKFNATYPDAVINIITQDNYPDFIL
ncbi:MAG: hypothetical protein JXJ04_22125 [Spirochaetales bacterium]|nr:hypothetical protein [Spirochaetales bacterium]